MEKEKSEFTWLTSKRPRSKFIKDARVLPYTSPTGQKGIAITFADTSWLKFAEDRSVVIAIVGYRIYFKGDALRGFKITKNSKRYHVRVFGEETYNFACRNQGHYYIKYDPREKLYYIDTSEKD